MNGVEHLILLIGTNPLPNYVTAKYFIDKNPNLQKVWFVHSSGNGHSSSTKEYADNIKNVLEKNVEGLNDRDVFEYVPLSNIENAQIIRNNLFSGFDDKLNGKVHLNYTGGTKVMGIHVYQYIKSLGNDIEKGFSYLSPRYFSLVNDYRETVSSDLRNEVQLSFEDLIELHGYIRKNEDREFLFEEALKIFEDLIENNQLDCYYNNDGGYNREIFLNSRGDLIEKTRDLRPNENLENFIAKNGFLKINNALSEEYQIFNEDGILKEELPSNKKVEHVLDFFDGDWFERYLFKLINEEIINENDKRLKNNLTLYNNWVIKKPTWRNLDFEIDVIMMHGYQLFGISCTTEDKIKSHFKNKGFEIILRTKQIGGDESKAILITLATENTKTELQNELEIETGGNNKNILVLGENDLKKDILIKRISKFIDIENG